MDRINLILTPRPVDTHGTTDLPPRPALLSLRFELVAQRWLLPGQPDPPLWRLTLPLHPGRQRSYYWEHVKRQALAMYLDGSSISAIGWVLHIKLGTVYAWVKKAQHVGELLPRLVQQRAARYGPARVISWDEMWS